MLFVEKLSKKYSNKTILNDINFRLKDGEIFSIYGPNGSGKTTFLKCLANLINYDSGKVKSEKKFIFLSDKPNIFGELTIEENLKIILRQYSQPFNQERFNNSLKQLKIENLAHLQLKFFSRGNMQRNKLLIAMNVDWDFLLIDEPFSNLDKEGIEIFQNIFENWKKDSRSIIFSSHLITESKKISDRNYVIKNKKLVEDAV